jgi:hypothetical protein
VVLGSPGHRADHVQPGFLPRRPGRAGHGAGHAGQAAGYGESDTVLLAGVCGPVPTDATFTWAKAKKLLGIR